MTTPTTDPRSLAPEPFDWSVVEPRYQALLQEELTPERTPAWLGRWSDLQREVAEAFAALSRAKDEDTQDKQAEAAYLRFVREVQPKLQQAGQSLRSKLLAVEGFEPGPDLEQMMRRFRNDADLYREANVPVLAEATARANEYNKLTGGLAVELDGQTLTVREAQERLLETDRARREAAWRAIETARLGVGPRLDALLLELLGLRRRLAENAGLPDYREYRWRELARFDYRPEDSLAFHDAIEAEVVPLLAKVRRRGGAAWVGGAAPLGLAGGPRGPGAPAGLRHGRGVRGDGRAHVRRPRPRAGAAVPELREGAG
jgi:oligoendopeptidase F